MHFWKKATKPIVPGVNSSRRLFVAFLWSRTYRDAVISRRY